MAKTHVQDVNGQLMVLVPLAIVEGLHLRPGSEVELECQNDQMMLRRVARGRYYLDDLIAQCDPEAFIRTDEDREWLESPPVGRELL